MNEKDKELLLWYLKKNHTLYVVRKPGTQKARVYALEPDGFITGFVGAVLARVWGKKRDRDGYMSIPAGSLLFYHLSKDLYGNQRIAIQEL